MAGLFNRRRVVYEGREKIIYEGTEPGTLIQYFKDDASTANGTKKGLIAGKGVLNNRISSHIMTKLEGIGVPTHFLKSLNMREQLVRQVEIIPLEIVVRNIAAGSLCKRLGLKEGTILPNPIIEFYFKKSDLDDPLVTENHIYTFGWADPYEIDEIIGQTYRVNDYLSGLFAGIGLKLVDFKLEYGRLWGEFDELYIILADEISPDNCRLWDAKTGEKLDKDRFREDLGNVVEGYQEIARRLGLVPQGGIMHEGSVDEKVAEGLEGIENELARERRLRAINKTPPKNTRGV